MSDKSKKPLYVKQINGVNVLHTAQGPAQCPFRNPFPMPHQLTGRVEFQVPVCSEACPFFTYYTLTDEPTGQTLEAVYFDCAGCDKPVNQINNA